MSDFKKLNLSTKILSALEKKGYTTPTPIQAQSIPHLLEGKDLLGIAQTGTGKTAAFALPILDNLFKSDIQVSPNHVRALILTPTRELASQIVDNIKVYGQDLGLKSAVIFGGVSINNQIKSAKQGSDIIVATPGRLLDLINQGHLRFSQIEIFVLDEADRMLDMGFIGDVKKIIAKLPKQRQTLFFSATMPKDVAVLADAILNDPVKVEVTPQATTVEKIDQRVNMVEKANKPLLLKSILSDEEAKSAKSSFLVFSKTKHGANRIVEFLEKQSVKVAAIHGNKSQSARERALDEFRQGKIKVLVATDIAARGIDIPAITHVINYDIPNHPESYVHRIGRTARAGREGIAISFCDNSERDLLKAVEKVIKIKLFVDETHPFHGVKASAESKSALDTKDRPRSGYRDSPKPRYTKPNFDGERKPSYFSENRRWKSDGDDSGRGSKPRSAKPSSYDHKKPEFNGERRAKPAFEGEKKERNFSDRQPTGRNSDTGFRSDYPKSFDDKRQTKSFDDKRQRPTFGGEHKPRSFSDENGGRPVRRSFDNDRKPSFGQSFDGARGAGDNFRSSKPRSFDDRRPASSGSSFGDRKPKFSSDENGGRPVRRSFDGDKKPSFGGGGFGEERRPRNSFNDDRKPRFEGAQFEGERRSPKSFSGDRKPSFGGSSFGGERRTKPSFSGGKKPFKPKK